MKKAWPAILMFLVLAVFFYPLWLQGKLIGPFDFLVNWYHPYKSLDWSSSEALYNSYLQFKTYLMSDVVSVVFPLKHFAIESLKKGQIPLWNPYFLSGAPHLANTQAGVFNPFNFWFLLLGYQNGFNPYIVSQTILAAIFMYLFLQSLKFEAIYVLLGAITYALSGYFIVWLPWGTLGYSYLYLPLTLFFLNRYQQTHELKFFFWSFFTLALSFYSGHIQTSVTISIAIYLYALWQNLGIKTVFLHFLATLGLSAPQLLPTLKLLQLSARQMATGANFYQEQTSSVFQLFNNFAPDYFGNPVTRNWWGQNNYAETVSFSGTIFAVLLLINFIYLIFNKPVVLKNRTWLFFNLLLLVGFVLATKNPISWLIFHFKIPLFSSSTFSRYLLLFSFSQVVLGLFTLKQLVKESFSSLVRTTTLIIITITGIWLTTFLYLPKLTTPENLAVAQRNLLLPSAIAVLFLSLWWLKIYLLPHLKKKILIKWALPICLSLVFIIQLADLFRFGHKYLPFSPREFFFPDTALSQYAQNHLANGRFYGNFGANFGMLYNLRAVNGADPLYSLNYAQLLFSSKTGKPEINDRAVADLPEGPFVFKILNILGVRHIIDEYYYQRLYDQHKKEDAPDFTNTFPKITKIGIYNIHQNPFAAKMAYFIPKAKVQILPQGKPTINFLLQDQFNPQKQAVINQEWQFPKIKSTTVAKKTQVKVIKTDEQLWELQTETTQQGILIINQSYFPQWSAYVNQQKVPIIKVNHVLQGILLNPGKYHIVLKYQDTAFTFGVALFLTTLLFFGYLAITTKQKVIKTEK